jgi:hypothetical protein
MTRPNRRLTSLRARSLRSTVLRATALRVSFATAVVLGAIARAPPVAAQACCAGGSLVAPTRLAPYDDFAVGLQVRTRSVLGSFSSSGAYTSSATEQDLEQDLAASFRLTSRGQIGVVVPYLETRRLESGVGQWGSGIGDLSFNARYDFLTAAEALTWPGFGLLASVLVPTGKSAGSGTNPSSTDATGTGTYNLTLGLDLEKAHGPFYGELDAWATYCFDLTVTPPGANAMTMTTSFPLQWTLLALAGYVFDSEAALAVYVNVLERGDDTLDGVRQPGTVLRLTTLGLSGVLPLRDLWRIQGTAFGDVPVSSVGRNEQGAIGLTAALVRLWR